MRRRATTGGHGMLEQFLLQRYPDGLESRVRVRECIQGMCHWFADSGLADREFLTELCSGEEPVFWQRLTEVLFAVELDWAGVSLAAQRSGPDLLVELAERRVWIEATCPEPTDVPPEWLRFESGEVKSFPDRQVLLRWTAAIAAKAEKLLGNPGKHLLGYLQKGVVGPDDAYVIAVNGRRLRDVFPQLNGINGYPFALEATLGVGYRRLHIDRETRAVVSADHEQHAFVTRYVVRGEETRPVEIPTRVFTDPTWAGVSAIWAGDIDDSHVLGNRRQLAVIHNPLARNPVPTGVLPAFKEYLAVPQDAGFLLTEIDGRLSTPNVPVK